MKTEEVTNEDRRGHEWRQEDGIVTNITIDYWSDIYEYLLTDEYLCLYPHA
jgi:hypothetical protein